MIKEINKELEAARRQGMEDFFAGNIGNPYAQTSCFYAAWEQGFMDAYKDFDVRR